MEKRKLMALASSAAMVMASMGIAPAVMADEVEKPEKITVMFDGTVFTQENGQAEFEARWEELTGIDLQIIQPDHSQYYDVLGQTIAGGDWPDVVLLGSTYYASYAAEGVLWDMTEAYDNSELKERITDQSVIDGLKIDGSLYGISPARGNGCITYVKKAWLDNCGLEVPTTYDEYLCRKLEPNVSTTRERFEVLMRCKELGIPTLVWMTPILPFINDTRENIEGLLDYCLQAGVQGILVFDVGVTLREGDREYFYQALDRDFPGIRQKYVSTYGNAYDIPSPYAKELMTLIQNTCTANGILCSPKECFTYLHEFPERYVQQTLF